MSFTMRTRILGFTLLELLVVISIAAILIALAVPTFSSTVKRIRTQSQARDVASALSYARSEAASRGRRVTVCHLNGNICDGAWGAGFTVFVDGAAQNTMDPTDIVLREFQGVGTNTAKLYHYAALVAVADSSLSFNGRGEAGESLSFVVCDRDNDPRLARAVLVSPVGQVNFAAATIGAVSSDIGGNALICP